MLKGVAATWLENVGPGASNVCHGRAMGGRFSYFENNGRDISRVPCIALQPHSHDIQISPCNVRQDDIPYYSKRVCFTLSKEGGPGVHYWDYYSGDLF